MPYTQVAPGQVIQSATMNEALAQGVLVFPSAAARTTAIPVPTDGMVSYLADLRQMQTYIGTGWFPSGGVMPFGVLDRGDTAQSVPEGWTKIVMTTAAVRGGMTTLDVSTLHLPYDGLYTITVRGQAEATPGVDSLVDIGAGYPDGSTITSLQGVSVFAGVPAQITGTITGEFAANTDLSMWVNSNAARYMHSCLMSVTYNNYSAA